MGACASERAPFALVAATVTQIERPHCSASLRLSRRGRVGGVSPLTLDQLAAQAGCFDAAFEKLVQLLRETASG